MAKQSFTTGQVLTSAQMTALQLNDYNQTVNAKVASYTLVASDAGTRITMSNASATTITVNTSLFAAGDTLFITNIGAGASTITAGTATVSTASSLVLAQYDSGSLYFTSTGVAIWQKYDGAAAASGSMTLLSTTAITTAASITLSSISGSYQSLILNVDGAYENTSGIFLQFNSNASSIYYSLGMRASAASYVESSMAAQSICIATSLRFPAGSGSGSINVFMPMYASTTTPKLLTAIASTGNGAEQRTGSWADITPVTSLKITMGTPTAQGTMYLYGVN